MYTTLFFGYGLHGSRLAATDLARDAREPVALVLMLPQFFLVWDNWRVAVVGAAARLR
jgi:hypothetical protein